MQVAPLTEDFFSGISLKGILSFVEKIGEDHIKSLSNGNITEQYLQPLNIEKELYRKFTIPELADIYLNYVDVGKELIKNFTTEDMSKKYIIPLTYETRKSYCELKSTEMSPSIGKASVFISHAWCYNFLMVIDALENYGFPDDTFFWFDLFSNSQIDTSKSWQQWCETFQGNIEKIHKMVMILYPWDNPYTLTRAWCLWELYCCVYTGSTFDVALSTQEQKRFNEMIFEKSDYFFQMVTNVDVRRSDASKPMDKTRIFQYVETSVGFAQVNKIVISKMRTMVIKKIRSQPQESSSKQLTLGEILCKNGEYEEGCKCISDALEMAENENEKDPVLFHKCVLSLAEAYELKLAKDKDNRERFWNHEFETTFEKEYLQALNYVNLALAYYKFSNSKIEGNDSIDTECNNNEKIDNYLRAVLCEARLHGCRYSKNISIAEDCLNEHIRLKGECDHTTACATHVLALFFSYRGEFWSASRTFGRCIDIHEKCGTLTNPLALQAIRDLAILYNGLDMYYESKEQIFKSLRISKEKLDENHPFIQEIEQQLHHLKLMNGSLSALLFETGYWIGEYTRGQSFFSIFLIFVTFAIFIPLYYIICFIFPKLLRRSLFYFLPLRAKCWVYKYVFCIRINERHYSIYTLFAAHSSILIKVAYYIAAWSITAAVLYLFPIVSMYYALDHGSCMTQPSKIGFDMRTHLMVTSIVDLLYFSCFVLTTTTGCAVGADQPVMLTCLYCFTAFYAEWDIIWWICGMVLYLRDMDINHKCSHAQKVFLEFYFASRPFLLFLQLTFALCIFAVFFVPGREA